VVRERRCVPLSVIRDLAPYLTMGLELAVAVVGMSLLGHLLDGLWGTAPWLLIAGFLMGSGAGFVRFFRQAMEMGRKEDRASKHETEHHEG
jgi:F0F1-type ATP synthase assembly protein I